MMNVRDLQAIAEACHVALLQMNVADEVLVGRDLHPFLEENPSGARIALAVQIRAVKNGLDGIREECQSILDHTPAAYVARDLKPPVLRWVNGRLYNESDGHTYWKVDDEWVAAGTFEDGSLDDEDGTAVVDLDMEEEDRGTLLMALDLVGAHPPPIRPETGPCCCACGEAYWIGPEDEPQTGQWRCPNQAHWPLS